MIRSSKFRSTPMRKTLHKVLSSANRHVKLIDKRSTRQSFGESVVCRTCDLSGNLTKSDPLQSTKATANVQEWRWRKTPCVLKWYFTKTSPAAPRLAPPLVSPPAGRASYRSPPKKDYRCQWLM